MERGPEPLWLRVALRSSWELLSDFPASSAKVRVMNSRSAVPQARGSSAAVSRAGATEVVQLALKEGARRNCRMSNHAEIRAKQRGVGKTSVRTLIDWADFEVPVGGGCVAIRLARAQYFNSDVCQDLRVAMDRIKNATLIVDECTGSVVTDLHDHGTAKGRVYKKGLR